MILFLDNQVIPNVKLFCNCEIIITDTFDYNTACNIDYKDLVTLDIITHNTINNQQLFAIVYTDHNIGYLNEVKLPIGMDGYYSIYHIILPTVDWYKRNPKNYYDNIYVTDCKKVYKVVDNELLEFNPFSLTALPTYHRTPVYIYKKDIFTTCHLLKCLVKWNTEYLKNLKKTFNKDFLWCTLNVIEILILDNQYDKAELIIEEIMGCGGLCLDIVITPQFKPYKTDNSSGKYLDGNCNCSK